MEIRKNEAIGEKCERSEQDERSARRARRESLTAGGLGALLAPQRGPGAEPRENF